MSDILAEICTAKRAHVAKRKEIFPAEEMADMAAGGPPVQGFAAALMAARDNGNPGIIAEIKKASPSEGVIREDFDPASLAVAYLLGGATCLSVLTDKPYFQGANRYLGEARAAVSLPILRKDFILDPWQVAESRAIGADCILLIMAALNDDQAAELEAAATGFGMDVLLEVHDEAELERALKLESHLIGINNRDLKTLKVSLETCERLAPLVPDGRLIVGESGIKSHDDLDRLAKVGITTYLIGSALMRADDVGAALHALITGD